MGRLKYIFHCILHMDYKSLFDTVKTVHEVSGKNRIWLFFDIIKCGFKYGAGYKDYLLCAFYDLNDKQRIVYERHPRSGCLLKGYQIPYWDKVMDICREAAHKVPQMGYIGWDVAITKDGPLFIEANNMPGHDAFPQMPLQAPDKIGILPVFQKYIKGL